MSGIIESPAFLLRSSLFLSLLHCLVYGAASSPASNIQTQYVAVEVGTDVIFNCTSNKRAIWTKLIPDGESARVEYIAIGKQLFDKKLAGKFR